MLRLLIRGNLLPDDDEALWESASVVIVKEFLNGPLNLKTNENFLQVGCCSHWLRPHQTRWTAAGGFAWPSGYGGFSTSSRRGLPEFDWSVTLQFKKGEWERVDHPSGKKSTVLRVAIPNRTAKHNQAAMDLRWGPSKAQVFLGWRKGNSGTWHLVAEQELNAAPTPTTPASHP
jgi:hypothetical protein